MAPAPRTPRRACLPGSAPLYTRVTARRARTSSRHTRAKGLGIVIVEQHQRLTDGEGVEDGRVLVAGRDDAHAATMWRWVASPTSDVPVCSRFCVRRPVSFPSWTSPVRVRSPAPSQVDVTQDVRAPVQMRRGSRYFVRAAGRHEHECTRNPRIANELRARPKLLAVDPVLSALVDPDRHIAGRVGKHRCLQRRLCPVSTLGARPATFVRSFVLDVRR